MSPALPGLPVVVLPEDNSVRGRTRPAASVLASRDAAIGSLIRLRTELLSPQGVGPALGEAMEEAVACLTGLAAETAVPALDTGSMVPIVPNHEYFGVRTAGVDDAYLIHEVSVIVARALADLRHARLDLNDRAAVVGAMTAVLEGLVPAEGAPLADPADGAALPGREIVYPGHDELTRWVITHHFYFVLNLAAAQTVSRATQALLDKDRDAAFDAVQEAIVYVRGFTAAMIHSGDMSAACYDAKVRPTMQPPAVKVALTGRTQPEHKAYRQAMRRLVKVSEPFTELFAADPELALARDALLEADLQDIERHVVITAALVGDDRSIVQGEAAAESAVGALRTMRHVRAELYRDLMRCGDPVTLTRA